MVTFYKILIYFMDKKFKQFYFINKAFQLKPLILTARWLAIHCNCKQLNLVFKILLVKRFFYKRIKVQSYLVN